MPLRTPTDPNRFARELFDGLPRRYDALAEILSFGQNRRWRRAMVDQIVPAAPRHVLDVAAGTAGVSIQLAKRAGGHVVGIDLTEAMLRQGQQNLRTEVVADRVALVVGRAEQLPFADATFDGLTFTYLLRYVADPARNTSENLSEFSSRALRSQASSSSSPGTVLAFLVVDLHTPRGVLPVAGRLADREWFEVGRFLGPSISKHYRRYPVYWTISAWHAAGITDVTVREMSLGGGLVMWGRKADA